MKEIYEGILEVLSCEIFMKVEFEREFLKELRNDGILFDLVLNLINVFSLDLFFIYWVSKFCWLILLKEVVKLIYFCM